MIILQPGFEAAVRSKFGVSQKELPDSEINVPFLVDRAEADIIRRVPGYAELTDPLDKLNLQGAAITYLAMMIAPSMARRLKHKVKTIDVSWEKEKVDWEAFAARLRDEYEELIGELIGYDSPLVGRIDIDPRNTI
ncbi:hypothetical protein DFP93_101230 [Aneurinibacillus soli]|uniref:Uncharacterized protein n=1 Tax=Aneurinibacillus soli TaxID=1500254 RepID=A0A0U5AWR1_9BACL|nr:hypothetical protein [Aneurinibacillus soli]PYE64205.1 hypothetical protein DFP93_101230 [Aneurinibacillus soli]BAU28154.1 hypothetical protein CB4_02328 [Aneurinibacillus soli]